MRSANPWFYTPRVVPRARYDVVCLPSSGASASAYRPWGAALAPIAEVAAVQLPGRGGRWEEPALPSIAALVEQLYAHLCGYVHRPLVLFGHSFGAIAAFELARVVARRGGPELALLAVSGRPGPSRHEPPCDPDMPRAQMVEHLRRLGGTPPAILEDAALLDLVLPPIRGDYRLLCDWRDVPGEPLEVPVLAYAGVDDPAAPLAAVEAWAEVTRAGFELVPLPGGHFYREAGLLDAARALRRRLESA